MLFSLAQDLYQKYTRKFSDELSEIEQKIDFGQNGSSNLERVTNEAIKVSKNLSSTWLDMSYDQKYELQQFVFPKGATYNKENNRFRTPETHLLFELTKRTTGLCENKNVSAEHCLKMRWIPLWWAILDSNQ